MMNPASRFAVRALATVLLLAGLATVLAAGDAAIPGSVNYAAFSVDPPLPESGWTLRSEDQTPTEAFLQREPWAPGVRAHVFASSKASSMPSDDPSPEALLAQVKLLYGRARKGAKPPEFSSEAGEFQGRPAAFFRTVALFSGAAVRGGPDLRVVTRGVHVRVPGRSRGLTMILYVETLPVGTEEKATDAEARSFLEKVKLK